MIIHTVKVGELLTNCYLVVDEKTLDTIVVDPGAQAQKIVNVILAHELIPIAIVNTHAHPDHVGANLSLKKEYEIPIFAHQQARQMFESGPVFYPMLGYSFEIGYPDQYVSEGKTFDFGESNLIVIHTPGHSSGSICLYDDDKILLTGDTLFKNGVGRVDLPGGSLRELTSSLQEKLFKLPKETLVYPGHGEATSIRDEEINLVRELGL